MDHDRRETGRGRAVSKPTAAVGALALLATLSLIAGAPAHPPREGAGVGEALDGLAKLAQEELRPPARRLASGVPGAHQRLGGLTEPASTVEAQLGIALGELVAIDPLASDPHHMSALLAVGRAYATATGRDPLTRTTINPEYEGLAVELAEGVAQLDRAGRDAISLRRGIRQLIRRLAKAKRLARALERRRDPGAGGRM
jgi:hypothetical protein